MRPNCVRLPVWLLLAASLCTGQPPKAQPKAQAKPGGSATATGVFVGRSGKPMAGAHLMLGEVLSDQEVIYARVKLAPNTATVTDAQGRFQFKAFSPGSYVIVYQPAGHSTVLPLEFSIKPLLAVARSTMPLLKGIEIGKAEHYKDRPWGGVFTLLKDHTFLSQGEYMKIWNASVRRNPGGPCMEVRKGLLWQENLTDKKEIKLEAWSY